jgi:chorismate mutase
MEDWRMTIYCRGVRGAITVECNEPTIILEATRELLEALVQANELQPQDVASVIFTVTTDLDAAHPARAARDMGWDGVALICATEIPVPASLPHCIRVLIHWNTTKAQHELRHVYLRDACTLRPDLTGGSS